MIPLYIFKFSPSSYIIPFLNFLNYRLFKFSTFHLLQPFLHLDFPINFSLLHFHLSLIPSKLFMTKKVNTLSLSLSLSLSTIFFSLLVDSFIVSTLFFLLMVLFGYYWFNCHITFVFIFDKFVLTCMHIMYFGIPILDHKFFFYPIGLIWFLFTPLH